MRFRYLPIYIHQKKPPARIELASPPYQRGTLPLSYGGLPRVLRPWDRYGRDRTYAGLINSELPYHLATYLR